MDPPVGAVFCFSFLFVLYVGILQPSYLHCTYIGRYILRTYDIGSSSNCSQLRPGDALISCLLPLPIPIQYSSPYLVCMYVLMYICT
jgi:hypothetical protein